MWPAEKPPSLNVPHQLPGAALYPGGEQTWAGVPAEGGSRDEEERD